MSGVWNCDADMLPGQIRPSGGLQPHSAHMHDQQWPDREVPTFSSKAM